MALSIWENKWLQVVAASIIIYFFCMDVSLYFRLQGLTFSSNSVTSSPEEEHHLSPISQIAMKTLLLDHPNHYIHVPLAVLFNEVTHFSKIFQFITPNMISVSHVFVALFGMRLLWSNSLSVRQTGVLLFEVRSFLDALDGAVARSRGHHNMIHLDIGSSGFFVDGVCDTFGSVALYVGVLVYLNSHAPCLANRPKTGYTRLPFPLLPLVQSSKDLKERPPNSGSGPNGQSSNAHHTRMVIIVIICSAMQMMLGSLFWNRILDTYHSLLESDVATPQQKVYQVEIFKSSTLWIIIWCWRICNPHALLEMILLSIFIDKLWEFLRCTQYYGFLVIFAVTAMTHAHIHYVKELIESGASAGIS